MIDLIIVGFAIISIAAFTTSPNDKKDYLQCENNSCFEEKESTE